MPARTMVKVVSLACLLCNLLSAQDESAIELEPFVVDGKPVLEDLRVRAYGDKVSILTQEQLEALQGHDLAAALRTVPGLSISRFNPVGAFGGGDGGAIYIRGHGSGRPGGEISIMLDGVPRFTGVWTHPLLDFYSVDNLHQVDVYKSPQPVLFGNMAFGAIDLRPKEGLRDGRESRLRLAGGSYGTFFAVAENSYVSGPFASQLVASHRESNGHRDNADGRLGNLSAHLSYQLSKAWSIRSFFNYTESAANDPEPVGSAPLPIVERYETDGYFVTSTLEHQYEKLEGYLKAYWDSGETRWRQFDGGPPPPIGVGFTNTTDYSSYGLRLRETARPIEALSLTGGYDLQIYGGETEDTFPSAPAFDVAFDRETLRNHSLYALAAYLWEADDGAFTLQPSIGARYNWNDTFDNQWGLQAGLVATVGDTQVYAHMARAYNYPGVYASIFNQRWAGFGLDPKGWRSLDAETLLHFEVGVQHRFNEWLEADVSVFYAESNNAIRFDPPPPPVSILSRDDYIHRGIEVTLFVDPLESLKLFTGVTYNSSSPDERPNLPGWTGTVGSHWFIDENWTVNGDLQYVEGHFVQGPRFEDPPEPIDSYVTANLKIARKLTWLEDIVNGSLYVHVQNLFDSDFAYQPGYPVPGINALVGLDMIF